MEIVLILSTLFAFMTALFTGIILKRLFVISRESSEIKEYIKTAVGKINQARYGNFKIKLPSKNDPYGLYKSLNSLFESISDRDLVINEYREKEKENYTLKEEFIAALTHDLKVPIIAQDKTFDLLMSDKFGTLNETQKDVVQKLKESNTELKEMVSSILETYKAENKGIELKIEQNINVNLYLGEIIKELENIAQNKELRLFSKEQIYADFDPLLIKRVLNNLISNAITHSKTTDKVDIHLNKTGDTFSIDVIDYGEGIDEDEIKKIFNKYYSITGRGKKLTFGLGLYVSNKIIKKHNGIIEVESKIGEGSIFRTILPIKNTANFSIIPSKEDIAKKIPLT